MTISRVVFAVCGIWVCGTPLPAQALKISVPLADLEAAAHRDSNDAVAHYNLALGYWSVKRFDDVERELRLATAVDSHLAIGYLALSFLPYARSRGYWGEPEDSARAQFRRAIEASDGLYRRAFMIDPLVDLKIAGAVERRVGSLDNFFGGLVWYWSRLNSGLHEFVEGRYDRAYGRFESILKDSKGAPALDSVPPMALWYHGLSAAHLNRNDEAIRDFQTLLEMALRGEKRDSTVRGDVPLRINEYRYVLAVLEQRAGRVNDAIRLYEEALTTDLGLYMAHERLADIYEDHGMLTQAIGERRAAVNANPDDVSLALSLGRTLARASEWSDAEAVLRQAAGENPRDARIPYYLGIIEQQLSKPADAKTAFTRFLSLAPSRYAAQIADAKQRLSTLP